MGGAGGDGMVVKPNIWRKSVSRSEGAFCWTGQQTITKDTWRIGISAAVQLFGLQLTMVCLN